MADADVEAQPLVCENHSMLLEAGKVDMSCYFVVDTYIDCRMIQYILVIFNMIAGKMRKYLHLYRYRDIL